MDYFKENKNVINRYISVLNNSFRKYEAKENYRVYFDSDNSELKAMFRFVFKPLNVVVLQKGRYIYFCTRYKKIDATLWDRFHKNNSFDEVLLKSYIDTAPWVSSLSKPLLAYLKTLEKQYPEVANLGDGSYQSTYDLEEFLTKNPEVLDDYDGFKGFKKACKDVQNGDTKILMYDDVFKNIDERDLIPVAYINTETNYLHIPKVVGRGKYKRTSTNFFYTVSVCADTADYLRDCIKNVPLGDWCYLDIESSYTNKTNTNRWGGWF